MTTCPVYVHIHFYTERTPDIFNIYYGIIYYNATINEIISEFTERLNEKNKNKMMV